MSARKKKKSSTSNPATPSTPGVASVPPPTTNEGLTEPMSQCAKILKELQEKPDAQPFIEPVDWKAYGLTDYPEIIKKPMDLGTIQEKLVSGKYQNNAEKFAADVRLVWKNAMTYNRSDSEIYMTADQLRILFEKRFTKLKKTTTKRKSTDAKGDQREVSRSEKVKFSQLVNQLDSDQLGEMVSIIQKDCPEALNEAEEDDVLEIEINSLDAATLQSLNVFANQCIETSKKKKKTEKT